MWSRSLIKTETLEKYKEYSRASGLKMWLVYEKAIECLLKPKPLIKTETLEKYQEYSKTSGLKICLVYEKAIECLLKESEQRE